MGMTVKEIATFSHIAKGVVLKSTTRIKSIRNEQYIIDNLIEIRSDFGGEGIIHLFILA